MSISFTGLASGLDTASWVEALVAARTSSLVTPLVQQQTELNAQQSTLSKVKTTFSNLLTSTQKFTDANFGVSKDIFSSNTVSSSDSNKVSATVTNSTPRQTISLEVLKLATATKVTSANSVSAPIDENTMVSAIASGSVKEGTMSFYVGDKRYAIDVSTEDTLGDIAQKMKDAAVDENGSTLINVDFVDGKFSLSAIDGTAVRVGANSDTSNLVNALALSVQEDGSVSSSYSIGSLDLNKPLVSVDSGFYTYNEAGEKVPSITQGTFTIGGAEITITETTTMNELISRINTSSTANATAFFDSVQNKIVITSKQEGAFNVNIEGGTSNITDVLGLTRNGNIIPETQVLGQNAEVKLNGSLIQSYSNTITSEVSGVAGLTIDLKDVTEEGKSVNIVVGQDTDAIVKQVEELITNLNTLLTTSQSATAAGADLQYDSSINSLRSDIRTSLTTAVAGSDVYKTLASIGITTGDVGTSVDADTNTFKIDKEKLTEALKSDPEAVKRLLIGDSEKGVTGLVENLQDIVEGALDVESGFFKNRETTISSQLSNLSSRIESKTAQVERYQEQLEKKFQAMETQIAQLQSQQSQMSSILS